MLHRPPVIVDPHGGPIARPQPEAFVAKIVTDEDTRVGSSTTRWRRQGRWPPRRSGVGLSLGGKSAKHMRFASTNPSGCSAAAAHVLWEHEVVGSNPTAPTTIPPGGASGRTSVRRRWAAFRAEARSESCADPGVSRREPTAVAGIATNGLRDSSPAPCSLASLRVLQRKPTTRSARRHTGPICRLVHNVDADARAWARSRRRRATSPGREGEEAGTGASGHRSACAGRFEWPLRLERPLPDGTFRHKRRVIRLRRWGRLQPTSGAT